LTGTAFSGTIDYGGPIAYGRAVEVGKKSKERRKHPRALRHVELSLVGEDPGILNKVDNISCSGVLCHTARKLPMMSKVAMEIALDTPHGSSHEIEHLQCQGVVVRCEPHADEETGGYGTAIFFTRMSEEDRARLTSFVDRHI
jgi:hypothetical protein